jgi:hypothetical protein
MMYATFTAEAESLGSTVHSCPIAEGKLSLGRRFRKIVREAQANDYRFSSVILGVVNSTPFTMRKAL